MRPDAPAALRIAADELAITDHHTIPATHAHRIVGTQIRRAAAALGYREGFARASGDGDAPLLGAPDDVVAAPGKMLVVDLDPRNGASRPGTMRPVGAIPGGFAVVIASLPFYDVRFTHEAHLRARSSAQLLSALTLLHRTAPGGLTALLATHALMDNPVEHGRSRIADMADLIGAIRLPAGTHRRTPGTDEVTDLLLLRRRPGGEPRRGPDFEHACLVPLDGTLVTINTYFDTNIDQVLGRLAHDPTGTPPTNLTVTGDPARFVTALTARIDHLIDTGRRLGLTMPPGAAGAEATVSPADIRGHRPKTRRLRWHPVPDADHPGPARPREDLAGPGLDQL